jgi:hypothetical protein
MIVPCEVCGADVQHPPSRPRRFCGIPCRTVAFTGTGNPRYRGGLFQRADGRTIIVCRDGSSLLYYRGLMAAELGRELTDTEVVHHLNGDCTDDRVENLWVTTQSEHIYEHLDEMHEAARASRKAEAA